MTRRWTPGPWEYRPQQYDDWGIVRSADSAWDGIVARGFGARYLDESEEDRHRAARTDPYEANARLIAAAPELYDALVAAVALLRAFVHEDTDRLAAAVLSGARAALAKAEGSG